MDILPTLIDAEEARKSIDITPYVDRVEALISGQPLPKAPVVEFKQAVPAPQPEAVEPAAPRAEEAAQQPAAPASPAEAPPSPPVQEEQEPIDEEMLEIFLEEAREVQPVVTEQFALWQQNNQDQEALATLRRAFHTLKGSGRMVGAVQVGEFAWAYENLLNRVIDQTLSISPELVESVGAAVDILPTLIDAEEARKTVDITPYVDRAECLIAGKPLPERVSEEEAAPAQEVAEPEAQEEPSEAAPSLPTEEAVATDPIQAARAEEIEFLAEMDEDLLDIFCGEAHTHLDTLRQFLQTAREEGTLPDETIVRALHTLAGSARMTGVNSVAEASHEFEVHMRDCQFQGQVVPADLLDLLESYLEKVSQRIDRLPEAGEELEQLLRIAEALRNLAPQEEAEAAEVSEEVQIPAPLESTAPPSVSEEASETEGEALPAETETEVSELADNMAQLSQILADSTESLSAVPAQSEPTESEATPDELQTLPEDQEMLGLFLEDAHDLLEKLDQGFQEFLLDPTAKEPMEELKRLLHTLKGSARLSGLSAIGDLCHAFESLLIEVDKGNAQINEMALDLAQQTLDTLAEQVDSVEQQQPVRYANSLIRALSVALEGPTEAPVSESKPPEEAAEKEIAPDELQALPEDQEMLGLFLEDAHDLLEKLDQGFRKFLLDPTAKEPMEELKRLLHTLKGSARLSGLSAIGDLCHAFESLLIEVDKGNAQINEMALDLAQQTLDTLAEQVDSVEQQQPVRHANSLIRALSVALEGPAEGAVPKKVPEPAPVPAGQPAPAQVQKPQKPTKAAELVPQIRVRADLINRLINHAGEISIYGSRLFQQNNMLGFRLGDLDQTVRRLREKLRQLEIEIEAQIKHRIEHGSEKEDEEEIQLDTEGLEIQKEFDTLELDRFSKMQQFSRSLAETVDDLVSIRTLLSDMQGESETLLLQQDRISNDLQDGLLRTRMVPFSQVVPRLQRLVRQTAQQLGKRAGLEVIGGQVELDRSIQERIVAPLEHLLRNAIAHGIEAPDQRTQVGKNPVGLIQLSLRREGNDAVIVVADDGAGLNIPVVRAKAIERGLIKPDAKVNDDEVAQLIMESGFSTAKSVSQIAGRGVGMDVVNTEIKQLSGTLSLETKMGKGTTFTIRLPLTLAILEAMLVQVGEEIYAVPHATMEAVARISREDLQQNLSGNRKDFRYAGNDYRVVYLGAMLKKGSMPTVLDRAWLPILLAKAGNQRVAFHIDSLLGNQKVVVKPLGTALSSIRWLTGGTILPDGRVAMILDLLGVIRSGLIQAQEAAASEEEELIGEEEKRPPCIMVVDDALTVRRVTTRILERQKMEAITARDGVDALSQLEERIPDLILLDIEMPRMDGYELTRHIRRSPRLKHIPIIMITSRTGKKHQEYAERLGVNRYLGKPYQEAELMDEISSLLLESSS